MVEETTGETVSQYYTVADSDGNLKKFYCPFQDRQALDVVLKKRRASLKRAIEIYMDEVGENRSRLYNRWQRWLRLGSLQ